MASGDITRYVITVTFHEDSLTEINELNNHLTRSEVLPTLTDDEGMCMSRHQYKFGFVSAQSADEIKSACRRTCEKRVRWAMSTFHRGGPGGVGVKTHNKCHSCRGARPRCALSVFSTAFCANLGDLADNGERDIMWQAISRL